MCIDVLDLSGLNFGVLKSQLHHAKCTVAIFTSTGDVRCVGAHAISNNLSQDRCAALLSDRQLLKNENSGSFADYKSVALRIPGTRRLLRFIVALGKCPHCGKTTHAHGRDAGFGSATNHHVGVSALNDLERIADGVRAGGASGGSGRVRALCPGAYGNITGSEIDNCCWNKKRGDAAGTFLQQIAVLALDHLESADTASDIDAHPLFVLGCDLQPGLS